MSNESHEICARKKGAIILRGDEAVEKHLDLYNAGASSIGNVLCFRQDVTVSEVVEEVYHFEQNLRNLNDDKSQELRTVLNEIDAKRYLLGIIRNSPKHWQLRAYEGFDVQVFGPSIGRIRGVCLGSEGS